MKALFFTLGCKVNQYETEAMRKLLENRGFQTEDWIFGQNENADCIIINSCTVTAEADRKLRQLVNRARREHPAAIVIVTGCMPQAFPEDAAALDGADIILGNAARRQLPAHIERFIASHQRIIEITPHSKEFEECPIETFEEHTRAFVKIEDGCNRFCSYCIIPYARGRVRSRSLDDLADEVTRLAQNGYKEIVLVGINLTAFGQDTGHTIADAVETVCGIDGIERVRLGSIEPDHLTPAILDRLAAQSKLCPQFHLALQSGCNATLKRMRRHYTAEEYAALCDDLRARFNGCAITTDFMVGFPGETDEEFAQSLGFVQKMQLARVHIFAYSRRPGTPAANAPDQVINRVKSARSKQASDACKDLQQQFAASKIGTDTTVLLETATQDGCTYGYTPEYVGVFVKTDKAPGNIVAVRITDAKDGECYAEEI